MKRYIRASWSGTFQPRAIMKEFDINQEDAKLISDYWYAMNKDSGFRTQREALEFLSRYTDIDDEIEYAKEYFKKHPDERY